MKSKLIYIANIRLPTEKAHGIQIMKMCEAFAEQGAEVVLIVPQRSSPIKESPFEYYGVSESFQVTRLSCSDPSRFWKAGFFMQAVSFAYSVVRYSFSERESVFYTRDAVLAWLLNLIGRKVAFEAHMGHVGFFIRRIVQSNVPMVVITNGLKDLYENLGARRVIVASDAVDIGQFDIPLLKADARKNIGLPLEKKVVLYTGHLYSWKGAHVLAEAAKSLPEGVIVVFVGGTPADIEDFNSTYGKVPNIYILGARPHNEIPVILKAADVLVIPNSAKEDISRLYTSPMKLFEYMASGVPMIASDLPSIREVLDERTSYMFIPDDSESLAEAIKTCLSNYEVSLKRAEQASINVKEYSWKKRAESILSFVN